MTHINVKISKAVATAEKDGIITAGMVGVPVSFMFDSWWDGLIVTAVFKGSGAPISVPLLGATETVVPWEVLKRPSTLLRIGAEGRLPDGTLVIPTTWATVDIVMSGANATDDLAKPPTPTAFDRIMSQIGNMNDLATEDKSSLVAAVNEAMENCSGEVDPKAVQQIVEDYIAANPPTVVETDPTVPGWAKQPEKPTYTAAEVGALPDTYKPPVDATLTQLGQAADAAVVGNRLSALSEEIVTTSESKVAAHNTGTDTHSDIRLLIQGLTDRLNAMADSDDTTLDQLSEIVAYIKSNRSLIEAITTSKVSVADIVDNLTTNVANKPLSSAQGVVIKTLIDALRNDKLDAAELTNAINTALAQAKESGEFDGADGKSAYAYAVEGGYTGTETAFAEKLAQEQLTGTTNELTPTQVYNAVSAGIPVKVQYTDSTYGLLSFTSFNMAELLNVIASQTIAYYGGVYILAELVGYKYNNTWGFMSTNLAEKTDIPDIPSVLPNPNAITFTGAVMGSYDGSVPVRVEIPSAVTDGHINSLIDTKLGVIENGSY